MQRLAAADNAVMDRNEKYQQHIQWLNIAVSFFVPSCMAILSATIIAIITVGHSAISWEHKITCDNLPMLNGFVFGNCGCTKHVIYGIPHRLYTPSVPKPILIPPVPQVGSEISDYHITHMPPLISKGNKLLNWSCPHRQGRNYRRGRGRSHTCCPYIWHMLNGWPS